MTHEERREEKAQDARDELVEAIETLGVACGGEEPDFSSVMARISAVNRAHGKWKRAGGA